MALADGDLDQAGNYLQQSLRAYLAPVAASAGDTSARGFQYLEQPDFVETLLAAARIRTARESRALAARFLSFAE